MGLHWKARLRRTAREVRPTVLLACPIMAGMVAHMLIGVADTIMVGRTGVVPLASAAFVNALTHVPFVFGIGLLSAVAVLTAQAFGAGRRQEAGEVIRHGLLIAVGVGTLTLAGIFFLRPQLHRFGQPSEVVAASGTYLLLFGASLLPALVAHACKQFAEALNRPWIPNLILLGGVALTVLLNWVLIYGNAGAPAMGLEGAGWATLIARTLMAVAMIAYVTRSAVLRPFQPIRWFAGLQSETVRGLWRIGWPVGLQHFMEVSAFVLAALMMGWLSADAIAAHQIAITCAATTFMFPLGIAMASSIRVGHAWGAGQFGRVRRIGFTGIVLAGVVMGFFGVMFVGGGGFIARIFVVETRVIALVSQMLLVAAIFQVADGVQIGAICSLRGLSDVRVPAMIAIFAYWVVAVPLGYLVAFRGGVGAVGIWIGLAVGLGVAAVSLVWRFHRKTRALPVNQVSTHKRDREGCALSQP